MASSRSARSRRRPERASHRRLDRRATGRLRTRSSLPRPQDPRQHRLVAYPRQRHAGAAPGPDRDRHRADPLVRALAGARLRQHPVHRRDAVRRIGPRHPPLGRQPARAAHRAPHPARVHLGRPPVPARDGLDGWGPAVLRGPGLRLHRVPPALGPEGVLGDRGRHQRGGVRAAHRGSGHGAAAWWPAAGCGDPDPLLRDPHLGAAGGTHGAGGVPPVRRHPPGDRRLAASPAPDRAAARRVTARRLRAGVRGREGRRASRSGRRSTRTPWWRSRWS